MASRTALPETLEVVQLDPNRWLIPRQGAMRVDGLIYSDARMMSDLWGDEAIRQVANVACLPGIVGRSIGMPDIHWGYGFPIGGSTLSITSGIVSRIEVDMYAQSYRELLSVQIDAAINEGNSGGPFLTIVR